MIDFIVSLIIGIVLLASFYWIVIKIMNWKFQRKEIGAKK